MLTEMVFRYDWLVLMVWCALITVSVQLHPESHLKGESECGGRAVSERREEEGGEGGERVGRRGEEEEGRGEEEGRKDEGEGRDSCWCGAR